MLLQSAVGFCVNYYLLEDFLIHPIQLKTAKIDHTKIYRLFKWVMVTNCGLTPSLYTLAPTVDAISRKGQVSPSLVTGA
jgi:hypothetical protein